MRKLLWFTMGFTAACCGCAWLLIRDSFTAAAVLALILSLVCGFLSRRFRIAAVAALLFAGLGSGLYWYGTYSTGFLTPAMQLDGKTQPAVIRTTDYSFETGYGLGADGIIQIEGRNYPTRVYLEEGEELPPGVVLEGSFRFRITVPGGKEEATSHAGKGIFLLAYQKGDVEFSQGEGVTFLEWASVLRRKIENALKLSLPEDVSPFAKALLLGDVTDLSYETDTHLKVSGIRHVAAVSGLHVSILFALVISLSLRKRFLSPLLGLPLLAVFAAITGFTPSVNRACIMSGLMLVSWVVNKEYDGLSALSFSALVMLIVNPLVITSVSFQLSCASVAGIFSFSEPIAARIRPYMGKLTGKSMSARLKRWFVTSVSTTLSAMVFTTPLCAWYFGIVSLIGVVTNLLTMWVISTLFYGLMAVCVLHFVYPAAAVILGNIVAVPTRFVLLAAKLLSGFPIACVYTASAYIVVWLILTYILLILYSIIRKGRIRTLCTLSALGLCLALLCSWAEPILHDASITVLDVGQGQCILLQSEGKNYLVDCGGDKDSQAADTAAELLLSLGISRLDGIIVTHTDADHAGGISNLLTRIKTEIIIMPAVIYEGDFHDTQVIYADRQMNLRWNNSILRIFGERMPESGNENSLCILLDTEKCDILITGDRNEAGEVHLLQTAQLSSVDILIAGHHGSKNATSEQLLKAVKPEIVCISVSEDNIYGHPASETLRRIYSYGCRVYRTDVHGTITIRR